MHNIIYAILPYWIAVRIEEAEWEIATRVYRKANFSHHIICSWSRFRAPDGACNIGAADTELVIVLRVGFEVLRFDLVLLVSSK